MLPIQEIVANRMEPFLFVKSEPGIVRAVKLCFRLGVFLQEALSRGKFYLYVQLQ